MAALTDNLLTLTGNLLTLTDNLLTLTDNLLTLTDNLLTLTGNLLTTHWIWDLVLLVFVCWAACLSGSRLIPVVVRVGKLSVT